MQYRAESLGLVGQVTTILRELIHERLGLFYDASQFDQVADRLAPLVLARGLGSFMDYYYLLKYSNEPDEWDRVMDALAVQETYFWREIDQIKAVVDHVVPSLARRHADRPLTIWSVPCATGEEPLTVAMVLDESGWFDRMPIEIIGSDASRMAIAKATRGQYGSRSFRNLPPGLREKYFTQYERQWTVEPELHRRVTYDVVNLVAADDVARHASAPVVFCRNVFIYFSEQSIRRAVEAFARSMPDVSYLCLGVSESLLRLNTDFELQDIGGTFMYAKKRIERPSVTAPALESERL
ncbi:MAG TPA: protein-glutamate O-methyltransferase CheR [Vicinamibacterales bacterium]|nr:protein-glutamate O-methyltransferase CheR [Vicinamibacterales bacterium]